jgi:hypothetical protein
MRKLILVASSLPLLWACTGRFNRPFFRGTSPKGDECIERCRDWKYRCFTSCQGQHDPFRECPEHCATDETQCMKRCPDVVQE